MSHSGSHLEGAKQGDKTGQASLRLDYMTRCGRQPGVQMKKDAD